MERYHKNYLQPVLEFINDCQKLSQSQGTFRPSPYGSSASQYSVGRQLYKPKDQRTETFGDDKLTASDQTKQHFILFYLHIKRKEFVDAKRLDTDSGGAWQITENEQIMNT